MIKFLFKTVQSLGHVTNGVLYLSTSLVLEGVEGIARLLGGAVSFLTRATINLPAVSSSTTWNTIFKKKCPVIIFLYVIKLFRAFVTK